jgi:sterol desaturase/sphingolipid hydroxylase (fatty acid hydroxylase superfamily)
LFVTPDVHRIHHSARIEEAQSNFGSVLSVWDRLFGSYRDQPQDGPLAMTVGLSDLRDPRQLTLWRLLAMPWSRSSAPAPVRRARQTG